MRTRLHDGPRWSRILAAVLGATLALWLLREDSGGAEFVASCTVNLHDTYDTRGTRFFEVQCGTTQGGFVVSVDPDLPIAKWLASHHKERVSVALGSRQ